MTHDAESNTHAKGFLRYGWRLALGLIIAGTIYIGINEGRWGPLTYSLAGAASGWAIATITWEVARRIAQEEIDRIKQQEIPAAVSRGAHTVIPAKERELKRARAAESLLRHVERLLRNEPNYQHIRGEIGKHLAKYRDYEQRPPDKQVAS